jgi:hypothetical protein
MNEQTGADRTVKDNLEVVYLALKIVTALCLIAALYEYSTTRPKYVLVESSQVGSPIKVNQSTGNVQVLSRGERNDLSGYDWVNLGGD